MVTEYLNYYSMIKGMKKLNIDEPQDYKNEEIDIKHLYNAFLRNKFLIGSIGFIFFIVACIFALLQKRVWEGDFQILVKKESQGSMSISSNLLNNSMFQRLLGGGGSNSLETQVGILESPSILMPIFNFINEENKKSNATKKDLIFSKWRESNLTIEIKQKTSILDISYRDTNKDLIIPVLNKMTSAYQVYSGKDKKRGINLAKDYLKNQIDIFKKKSSHSIKKAQDYGIDQDLTILDINQTGIPKTPQFNLPNITNSGQISSFTPALSSSESKKVTSNTGIENIRVKAANEIRNIDYQIKKIKELKDSQKQKVYLSLIMPEFMNEGLPKELDIMEKTIIELKSKYTENNSSLQRAINRKKLLLDLLKEEAISYLNTKRMLAEARMESAMRPKGVILKYKSLLREASRDEDTLISLENQLRIFNLEEAKIEDPWELITKPTLKKNPVAPRRKIIGLLGLLIGLGLGTIIAFIREKKSDLIFEDNNLEEMLGTKVLETINLQNKSFKNYSKKIFIDEIINYNSNSLKFMALGSLDNNYLRNFKDFFKNDIPGVIFEDNFNKLNNEDTLILITKLGEITKEEVKAFKRRMMISENKPYGIILLS